MSNRPGEAEFLAAYDPTQYPPFALTVDLTIFTIRGGALTALLVQRRNHPYRGFWALPGGHVTHGKENAEQAARRELNEETGIDWSDDVGPPRAGGDLHRPRPRPADRRRTPCRLRRLLRPGARPARPAPGQRRQRGDVVAGRRPRPARPAGRMGQPRRLRRRGAAPWRTTTR